MREISTEKVKIGENVIIDGVEYAAEEAIGKMCDLCAFHDSYKCENIPCNGVIFKRCNKGSQYRPYKDTDEMIEDYKKRFKVSNVPTFYIPLIWVKYKSGAMVYRRLITAFTDSCVGLDNIFTSVRELFDGYTYLDGSPCGIKEE